MCVGVPESKTVAETVTVQWLATTAPTPSNPHDHHTTSDEDQILGEGLAHAQRGLEAAARVGRRPRV